MNPRSEKEGDALHAAHVKLGRPNTATHVVEPGSETVRSALANDAPRGGGTVAIGDILVWGDGLIAPR